MMRGLHTPLCDERRCHRQDFMCGGWVTCKITPGPAVPGRDPETGMLVKYYDFHTKGSRDPHTHGRFHTQPLWLPVKCDNSAKRYYGTITSAGAVKGDRYDPLLQLTNPGISVIGKEYKTSGPGLVYFFTIPLSQK